MKALKSARIVAASLGVLAFGAMAATPAMAFDKVDWDWTNKINEKADIDVDVKIDLASTGLVQVEKLQVFLGTVSASSTVHDIDNNQFRNGHYIYVYCYPVFVCDPFDATTQLPSVISTATAVGNNQSITSDVPVFLHDGQFVANTWANTPCDYSDLVRAASLDSPVQGGGHGSGNLHTDLALAFTLLSGFGLLAPADISASSNVWDIKNATVDSAATAVANNLSVKLESSVDGSQAPALTGQSVLDCKDSHCGPKPPSVDPTLSNHIVIADITQFAYANVSAVSNVCDVTLNDYSNLSPNTDDLSATLGRPIVSSVATAVGNNVSITVGTPAVAP